MKLDNLTYEIRGCIYDVYKTLGPGLLESVYEEAMMYELDSRKLFYENQVNFPVVYKGKNLKKNLILDLVVEDSVIIELKSVEELKKVHFKQLYTYLKLTDTRVGFLVNFNVDDILAKGSINRIVYNY